MGPVSDWEGWPIADYGPQGNAAFRKLLALANRPWSPAPPLEPPRTVPLRQELALVTLPDNLFVAR